MSFLQIKSTNPNLSFVLQKNPSSGGLIKTFGYGLIFGYYTKDNPNEYNLYFKDGDDEVTVKTHPDEETEYLNLTRFNSSSFIISAVKEFFGHLENNRYDEKDKDVEGYENVVMINMVYVGIPKYLEFFSGSFKNFEISYEVIEENNFRIVIKTKKTIHELINYISLMALFLIMITEREHMYLEEALIQRFFRVMNNLNAGYYIRYLFKLKIISDKGKLFKKYKSELENVVGQKVLMEMGDTHMQRISYVTKNLNFDIPILDVGCGEGRHLIPLSKKVETIYGVDTDPEALEELQHRLKKREIDNARLYSSIDDFYLDVNDADPNFEYDIVCSEVIEHIELDKLESFLTQLFEGKARKIIITTPNAEFNKYYSLEGFRHPDHKFEMTSLEFRNYMIDFTSKHSLNKDFEFEFNDVGDSVDGIGVSQAIVYNRRK